MFDVSGDAVTTLHSGTSGNSTVLVDLDGTPGLITTLYGESVAVYELTAPDAPVEVVSQYVDSDSAREAVFDASLERFYTVGRNRVVSLAYAGEGLGGFDRDMARVRGIRSGELRSRAETVAAVLGRDPVAVAAVREHLVRRRDQAAARLAFELAGRIQEELDAVAWVTSEQKVTVPEAVDADVHGWADGVLVRFEIRGGRLCAWRQRVCRAEAAEPLVAATPGTWARFARRNAELAGRLYPPGDRAPEGPVT